MTYSKEDVKAQIELEDVMNLLDYLGAEPEQHSDHIVCRTICHSGDSKKLYYYDNDGMGLFQCYTNCGSFDIFELVQKVQHLEDLNTAIYFVVNFLNLQGQLDDVEDYDDSEDWKYFRALAKIRDEEKQESISNLELPEYDLEVIKNYPQPRYLNWERDGIPKEVCDYMHIHYDPVGGNILIPHFDEKNRCVGIRQRTLVQEEEQWGKYRPWKHGSTLYNHPLAFNLYTDSHFWKNIQDMKTAIVFEAEKSVLEFISYFGTAANISCAVCGHSLSKYQFRLLKEYGVKEIVIAFDKDYTDFNGEEYKRFEDSLVRIHQKFSNECQISFIVDLYGLLGYKDSPVDKNKEVFYQLFKERKFL